MVMFVVEHAFDPPLTEASLKAAFDRLGPCLETHGAKWRRSYLSADMKRLICEFEAGDAESLRASMRSAKVPFDKVWQAALLT